VKKTSNGNLDRNLKKQKFLEKIEEILDEDDEEKFTEFLSSILRKKAFIVDTANNIENEKKLAITTAIQSLDYLKNQTIVSKKLNIDNNKLNDTEYMQDQVKKMLQEIFLDIVNSRKYRIDILKNYTSSVVSVSVVVLDSKRNSSKNIDVSSWGSGGAGGPNDITDGSIAISFHVKHRGDIT